MITPKTDPLTFKDIAQITGLTVRAVRRNQDRLGLRPSRIEVNPRVILFNRTGAMAAIKRMGFEWID